jgi:hypothetical protein
MLSAACMFSEKSFRELKKYAKIFRPALKGTSI